MPLLEPAGIFNDRTVRPWNLLIERFQRHPAQRQKCLLPLVIRQPVAPGEIFRKPEEDGARVSSGENLKCL